MTLKWYELHLQEVIRENEQLKFTLRKKMHSQPARVVAELFTKLFPEIPQFGVENTCELEEVVQYYRQVVQLWLRKQKQKVEFVLSSLPSNPNPLPQPRMKQCSQERNTSFLQKRIKELQVKVKQITEQIEEYEANQQKYLGEIALLRSITKKLEFQIANKQAAEEHFRRFCSTQAKRYGEEIVNLRREVDIWRGEYDRIWIELNRSTPLKPKQQVSSSSEPQELMTPNTRESVYTIRCFESQHTYIVEDPLPSFKL